MPVHGAAAARPRDIASARTRRAILAAAEHVLAARGEDGFSTREVCARARVTPPTLYHHFGDRAALIDAVVDRCFAAFDRSFRRPAEPQDPVDALRWSFDRYLEYGMRHPAHYQLMFQRRAARPTPAARASFEGLRQRVDAIRQAGRLRVPVDDAAAAFWAVAHGLTSLVLTGGLPRHANAIQLTRDAVIAQLTADAPGQTASALAAAQKGPRR